MKFVQTEQNSFTTLLGSVKSTSSTDRQQLRVQPDPAVRLRVSTLDVVAKDRRPAVVRRPTPFHENKVVVAVDNFRLTWNAWSI